MQFCPGIYEHAAACIGRSPWETSRSSRLLSEAHEAAWRRYRHPLLVVGIDVYNLEPEAYGANIPEPRGNNLPSIANHPCCEIEELPSLDPLDPLQQPRIEGVLEAGQRLMRSCPETEVRIPVCGPFALATGLLGMNELLMAVVEDPDELFRALSHLLEGQKQYFKAIQEAGLRPILFESGTTPPLLSLSAFQEIEAPLLSELLSFAKTEFGEAIPCIIGGDAAPIARDLIETGPGYVIAPSETDQRAFLETAREFPETHVRINLPTALLLETSLEAARDEAEPVIALSKTRPNTSIGCGVVPFETNPDLLIALRDQIEGDSASLLKKQRPV